MDEFFLNCFQEISKLVHRLRAGSQTEQQGIDGETALSSAMLQKHIRVCLLRMFFDGSDLEEEKSRGALARHAQAGRKMRSVFLLQRPSCRRPSLRGRRLPRLTERRPHRAPSRNISCLLRVLSSYFEIHVADLKAARHVSPRRSWW